MPGFYNESDYENSVIQLFEEMGYAHVYGSDNPRDLKSPLYEEGLRKHKYPPEGMDDAVATVMLQCELWTDNNDMDRQVVSYAEAFNKKPQDLQMVAEEPAPYGTKKED